VGRVTLVVQESIHSELLRAAAEPLETAGVLLCRVSEGPRHVRLFAREVIWVEASAYAAREPWALSIRSEGYVHALGRAEQTGTVPVWLHTHPGIGSWPVSSAHDNEVDGQIADLFRMRSGSMYYGALIISPTADSLAFSGFLENGEGARTPFDRIWHVSDRLRLIPSVHGSAKGLPPTFDRNIRAFGAAVQQTLRDLRIAVVGCGGTGSSVAEQLARLGARHLRLFDPDELSETNVTRVYGSRPVDVGRRKVDVVRDHLVALAPDIDIIVFSSAITRRETAIELTECDVVFGCTDDNAGRLILSRLATYFVVPVIDCGVLLSSGSAGALTGIDGRVTTLIPGQACLVCRNRVDLKRAAADLLTPGERERRIDEGYAPALGRVEPAVVTFTTAVASFAVSELLERLIGYGPEPRPSEMLLRAHEREISTNVCEPLSRHYCHGSSGRLGLGPTEPFLEQTWPDCG
jgi:molybdopterin/thiamine biosynthesis adenylyltransferase